MKFIGNYSGDAGAGSQVITNLSEGPGWRAALLGTVAAGSLWLYSARSARAQPDDCTITGASPNQTATCQGDQSDGISSAGGTPDFNPADVDTLSVNNLIEDPADPGSGIAIQPASGVDGIYFHRAGAGNTITINSDTTPYSIFVTGNGANGIDALLRVRLPSIIQATLLPQMGWASSRGQTARSRLPAMEMSTEPSMPLTPRLVRDP